jgi:vacuolar-type H+-ATPase subunit I/STV1
MSSSVALYEALTSAPDERARARVIAEAFERLEERYPHLPDLVTHGHLRETELRLQKEIEQVRADLSKEIEQVRAELREAELRLQKEIEQVRADLTRAIEQVRADLSRDIERVRGDIARAKVEMLKWMVPLMLGQVAVIAALVKLL